MSQPTTKEPQPEVQRPPSTQRAVVQDRYGAPNDVLSFSTTYPVTPPSPSRVQIKVHAASVNPIDWQMLQGNRSLLVARSFPFVPLFDLSGVVVAVGDAVTRFKVGDAVHADNNEGGGAAEFVNVEQDLVSLKPEAISFAEAAALPLAAQTALFALEKGDVGEGSRVCIIGASGAVGSFAVQIAKALGAAHVVGVCSGKNGAFVRSLGADAVVDYTATRLHDAVQSRSLDVVIDCVGGRERWLEAKKVLVPGGRFVTIARDEDGKVTVASAAALIGTILGRQLGSFFGDRTAYVPVFLSASHRLLDRVDELVKAGQLRVHIDAHYDFSLEGITRALERSKSGRTVGKLVIEVAHGETGNPASQNTVNQTTIKENV